MKPILQTHLPEDMYASRKLPGIQPVRGPWLTIDEAYAGQMTRRAELLEHQRGAIVHMSPQALEPCRELLGLVLDELPALGFDVSEGTVLCPDGREVRNDQNAPLDTLTLLVQQDFCLLSRHEEEHVLDAAVLCFPASWMLSEKAGRPLTTIHDPVSVYDDALARRVQRLFDGVQVGRPIWRFNQLWYEDPELHQPRSAFARRDIPAKREARYFRTERQTVMRLPKSKWVVFVIHTLVIDVDDVPQELKDMGEQIETISAGAT